MRLVKWGFVGGGRWKDMDIIIFIGLYMNYCQYIILQWSFQEVVSEWECTKDDNYTYKMLPPFL